MVNVLIGLALGFLAGLGIGGGSLLILWLTLALEMPADTARVINLLFFLPAAIAALLFRKGNCKPRKSVVLPAAAAAILTAAAVGWFCRNMDTGSLRKLFGILLIFTGIRELCYRPRKLR